MRILSYPYLPLALPNDPPSREVERLQVRERDDRLEFDGDEAHFLARLIMLPIKG